MRFKRVMLGALAAAALAGPTQADAVHAGPGVAHLQPKPHCAPPTVPVWGRVTTRSAVGWHCTLPPAPNCGKHANPKWRPATSTWSCEACPPGELAYSTPAPGGGRFGHCKKPLPGHRKYVPVNFSTHLDSQTP